MRNLHCKYTDYDDSPESTHNLVLGLIPPGAHILEFGCATGYMSHVLASRLGCSVVGVELDAEAAEEAARHCARVLVGDAEELDLEAEIGDDRFDVILFADVLEHLREPATLLQRVRPLLAEEGMLVASIPNIAHASVRLALLTGSFRYGETGLIDKTHLRFFTREGIQDLFESSGYGITQWLRRRLEIEESEIWVPAQIPDEARAWATADTEARTYQFVVRAVPSEPARQLPEIRRELRIAQDEVAVLRTELTKVEGMTADREAELDALRRAHEALSRRLVAERAAFADGIARVQANLYGTRSWRYTAPLRGGIRLLRRLKP